MKLKINRFVIPEADGIDIPINFTTTFDATGVAGITNTLSQIKSSFNGSVSTSMGRLGLFANDYFSKSSLSKYQSAISGMQDSVRSYQPSITVGDLFDKNSSSILEMNNAYGSVLDKFRESTPVLQTLRGSFENAFKADYVSDLKEQTRESYTAWRYLNTEMRNTKDSSETAGKALKGLASVIRSSILIQIQALAQLLRRAFSFMEESFTAAGDYVESINLYTMSVGDYATAGKKWAEEISNALYLDTSEIYQYTGSFFNLTRGLGATAKAADLMSRNLTQLTYDMSSYLNIDVEMANNKLMSAMSGQTKAVTSVGIAVQSASLQELAYSLNIDKAVESMTQAEKTYLRYIQIMRTTTQMQGDLGRTIITPTNAMRLLRTQLNLLSRAIGQVFTPIIMETLPAVIAFTQVLTELAQSLAKMFGYKLEDYLAPASSVKALSDSFGDLEDASKAAGDSIHRTLAPFDELNVVEMSKAGKGAGSDSVLADLEQYLEGYDMLEFYTDSVKKKIESIKATIKTVGPIIAAAFSIALISKFLSKLGDTTKKIELLKTPISKIGEFIKKIYGVEGISNLGKMNTKLTKFKDGFKKVLEHVTKTVVGIVGTYDGMLRVDSAVKNLVSDTGNLLANIGKLVVGMGETVASAALFGSQFGHNGTIIGAAVGGIAVVSAAFAGLIEGIEQRRIELAKKNLFGDLVISVDEFNNSLKKGYDVMDSVDPHVDELSAKLEELKESFDDNLNTIDRYAYQFSIIGDKISNEDGEKFKNSIENLFNDANEIIDTSTEESYTIMSNMLKNTTSLTEEEQRNLLKAVSENGEYRKTKTQEIEDSVYAIWDEAIKKRGYLTQDEKKQIQELLDELDRLTKRAVTQTEADLRLSQENFNSDSLELAEESYNNFLKARDAYAEEEEKMAHEQYAKALDEARKAADGQLDILIDNNEDIADEIERLWNLRLLKDDKGYDEGLERLKENNDEVANELQRIWELRETGEEGALELYKNYQQGYQDEIKKATDNIVEELSKKYKDLGIETEGLVNEERQILEDLLSKLDPDTFQELRKQFLTEAGMIGKDAGKELIKKANDYTKNNDVIIKGRAIIEDIQGGSGTIKFSTRAAGGFPETGEMFIAREAGPEMVGRIGNKTAVANNDQITNALTNALTVALKGTSNDKPNTTIVNIGGKKVYEGIGNYIDSENDRYGTNYVKV